ncbi:hypothetical protein CLCR_04397 [Cladophialophora carrionii]|uniref:Uncharacterized protein n=1 Tax=Cladophialophora carrionii TaxID=86049 RepID=A0A1C1CIR4_9EURO|nr:hypothetical protein CLCR_04397 [Cladophialophora carrionii]
MATPGGQRSKASDTARGGGKKRKSDDQATTSSGLQLSQKQARDTVSPLSNKKPKFSKADPHLDRAWAFQKETSDTVSVPAGGAELPLSNVDAFSHANGPRSSQEQSASANSAALEWMRTGSVSLEWMTSSAAPEWVQQWATTRRRAPSALDSDLPMNLYTRRFSNP